ncbi:MAG: PRC-barrel domain-containing protein [bacterium]
MKTLITTTAMVLALGFPAALMADTAAPAAATTSTDTATSGFLASRAMNEVLATDLIGHDVYARRTPTDMTEAPMAGAPMATMSAAELDAMDDIGQINDLVLSSDGKVDAVVIGVGGFLGVGEQDVAVTMNEVSFAASADNPKDMYVIVNTSGDMLKTSPAFDRTTMMNSDAAATAPAATDPTVAATDPAVTDQNTAATDPAAADQNMAAATDPAATDQMATTGTTSNRPMLTAPSMTRDGYTPVTAADVSIDTLIGKKVYGPDDTSVAAVDDVTVDASGAVQKVIIDFGGFLGIGKTKVALDFNELTILTNADNSDIRVYVDATKDQIKAMPVYVAPS